MPAPSTTTSGPWAGDVGVLMILVPSTKADCPPGAARRLQTLGKAFSATNRPIGPNAWASQADPAGMASLVEAK